VWYNPDLVSAFFMIRVIGTILYALTSILTATAVVREGERAPSSSSSSPIRPWAGGREDAALRCAGFLECPEVLAIGHWWLSAVKATWD
jgi:hypothetical protein